MSAKIYPLKFMPLFKNKLWGGNKIKDKLGVDYSPLENCGELWTLSGVEGSDTLIENGFLIETSLKEAIQMYTDELVGEKNFYEYGEYFPLLFKIIDANDMLSIQVHPDDDYARTQGHNNGKTEMWYVLDADEDSQIISGFNKDLTQAEIINRIRDNELIEALNSEKAEKGDLFYIPSGRVHAIGGGVMLAEIQQSSDTTYRLYDWDREDENGEKRELHIPEAIMVMDRSRVGDSAKTGYDYGLNRTVSLVESPYFTTNLLHLSQGLKKDYALLDSFVVYLCVEGSAMVETLGHRISIKQGEAMLIPAIAEETIIEPQHGLVKILETYII